MQKGLGLKRKMANRRASAVRALSPPESRAMDWVFSAFPGGWADQLDAALQHVFLIQKLHPGLAAAEKEASKISPNH